MTIKIKVCGCTTAGNVHVDLLVVCRSKANNAYTSCYCMVVYQAGRYYNCKFPVNGVTAHIGSYSYP